MTKISLLDSYMLPKKYLLFAVAAVFAVVLFYSLSKGLDGFQNTAQVDDTDIKVQMCEIFKDTYQSLTSTINKMEKSNVKVSDNMKAHFDSIKQQMEQHGC